MNITQKNITFLIICGICCNNFIIYARTLLTPLPIYPSIRTAKSFFQETDTRCIIPWILGFDRTATKARACKQVPLAQLFFGASSFKAQDALNPASRDSKFLPFSDVVITPQVTRIKDRGIFVGLTYLHHYENKWRFGAQSYIPWRSINVKTKKVESSLNRNETVIDGQSINNVFIVQNDTVTGTAGPVRDYAARLDFLNKLPLNCVGPGTKIGLVNFSDPTSGPNDPTIGTVDITEKITTIQNQNPVTIVFRSDGTPPPSPFGILLDPTTPAPPNTARGLPALSGDGTSADGNPLTDNDRARFVTGTDYKPLGTDTNQQSHLWIVPSVLASGRLTDPAATILNIIEGLLNCVATTSQEIFESTGLVFDDTKTSGIGDWKTDLFIRYHLNPRIYFEWLFGIQLPTSKKLHFCDVQHVFKLPVGNNGHTELTYQLGGYYKPCTYFDVMYDLSFTQVLTAREWIPATFSGATIKNLGPVTPADINWSYVMGHLDGCIHIPIAELHWLHILFGYELYHKHKDHIDFIYVQERDATGAFRPLDHMVAESKTNIHGHTLYLQGSYQFDERLVVQIGGDWVVGGLNVAKMRGWFAGIQVNF